MRLLLTSEVADLFGLPAYRIDQLIRRKKVPKPAKDAAGRYIWTEDEVQRVRDVLNERKR